MDIRSKALLDLTHSLAGEYLSRFEYPWQALPGIKDLISELGPTLDPALYEQRGTDVWVARSAVVYPTAHISGPCIIGPESELRPGAFVRGSVLVGSKCVVGNSTELKNVILFDNVQVPHYNYVGDSILGFMSHMGAGSITSNVKSDRTPVVVRERNAEGEVVDSYETGLKKMGAVLGDHVEIGCNSVLNPGTVVGPHSNVYPLSSVRGVVAAHSIYKQSGCVCPKQ